MYTTGVPTALAANCAREHAVANISHGQKRGSRAQQAPDYKILHRCGQDPSVATRLETASQQLYVRQREP